MGERFVVGNWKLNKTCTQTEQLIGALVAHAATRVNGVRCVLAPPATALFAARRALGDHPMALCAQHIHATDHGALTGEVSGPLVAEAGATYVLVGHSERRTLFYESDVDTNQQLQAAERAGLTPIVCVGETAAERQAGHTDAVVARQLQAACAQVTAGLHADGRPNLMVAYEPIWAIGTGSAAAPHDAQRVHSTVRQFLQTMLGAAGAAVPLLYGGSVTAEHAGSFVAERDIDGVLVGGASLQAPSFLAIIQAVAAA